MPGRNPPTALTIRSDRLERQILTRDTRVSDAYDPQAPPTELPRKAQATALWDTGASATVISDTLAADLGLAPTGMVRITHAGGASTHHTYIVNVFLPNHVEILGVEVSEAPLSGFDMLIGMDIITLGDFAFTNKDGRSCFSFRMPSLADTDYTAEINRLNARGLNRNDPCWCGSGKKLKKCHGKG
jgi:hypothetical protein